MNVEVLKSLYDYISKAFTGLKPLAGFFSGVFCYVCFPEKVYLIALTAVSGAAFMDIVTKSYAIIKNNGGYKKAIKKGKLFSKQLWRGTEVKIVSYLTIAILTGLAYRVIYLKEAGIILGSFVYSVMFMREFQSNIENLIEAGADLDWLLLFSKKKNKELLEKEGIERDERTQELIDKNKEGNGVNNDYEQRI